MATINDKRLEFPQIVVGDSVTLRQQLVGRIPTRRQYLQEIRRPKGNGDGGKLIDQELEILSDARMVMVRPRPQVKKSGE